MRLETLQWVRSGPAVPLSFVWQAMHEIPAQGSGPQPLQLSKYTDGQQDAQSVCLIHADLTHALQSVRRLLGLRKHEINLFCRAMLCEVALLKIRKKILVTFAKDDKRDRSALTQKCVSDPSWGFYIYENT